MQDNLFNNKFVDYWNFLPVEVIDSSSLDDFIETFGHSYDER